MLVIDPDPPGQASTFEHSTPGDWHREGAAADKGESLDDKTLEPHVVRIKNTMLTNAGIDV